MSGLISGLIPSGRMNSPKAHDGRLSPELHAAIAKLMMDKEMNVARFLFLIFRVVLCVCIGKCLSLLPRRTCSYQEFMTVRMNSMK